MSEEGTMELSPELIGLRSTIDECANNCGDLECVDYDTGTEASVQCVRDKLKHFLTDNNYMTDPFDTATANNKVLERVILCLLINTKLGDASIFTNLTDCSYLLGIMPKLSKFLFLNTMIELQLMKHLMKVTHNLPLTLVADLFENVNDIITGSDGEKVLKNVETIIYCFIHRLNIIDTQDTVGPVVEEITEIVDQLLMNLNIHPSINMADAPDSVQYLHIGYIFIALLKMLKMADENNPACSRIIQLIFNTIPTVTKYVTLEIFCHWAEVQAEDISLQYHIGINAYEVLEKYENIEVAPAVLQSLSCMARKPPTLAERISMASPTTIIRKVNMADENQIEWFKAFLRTPIFDNDLSWQCLDKWSTLCDIGDALHILEEAYDLDDDSKHRAIKCITHLSTYDMSVLIAKFFACNGPWNTYIAKSTAKHQLRFSLKRLNQKDGCSYTELAKDLLLFLLESPREVLSSVYQECFEHYRYVNALEEFFMAIKNLMSMKLTALEVLKATLDNADCFADSHDAKGIYTLLKALLDWECLDIDHLFKYVLRPLVSGFDRETDSLYVTLRIIRDLNINSLSAGQKEILVLDVLNILERHRIMYTSYSTERIEVCNSAIGIMKKLCSSFEDFPSIMASESVGKLNKYYLTLKKEYAMPSLLMYLFPDFDPNDYQPILNQLIKILSRCVSIEWLQIVEDLVMRIGTQKSLEAITDALILMSQASEPLARRNEFVFKSLSFYIRCYRICIEKMIEKDESIEFGTEVVKNICRMLTILPKRIRQKEGLRLIKQFNDNALKVLSTDKQFVGSLPEIDEPSVTQIIAQKMIN